MTDWLEQLWRDVRYAVRTMRQQPVFAVTSLLALTLGIGATTAIFTLIDVLLLRALPVREPQQLVQVGFPDERAQGQLGTVSYAIVGVLAEQDQIFAGFAGYQRHRFNVGAPGALRRIDGAVVSGEYYDTLGVRAAAGRVLRPDDDRPGAPPVAVLEYGYWQREYAGDPAAVGRTILLNGAPATIVGVSEPGFSGSTVGAVADVTAPIAALAQLDPPAAVLLTPGNFWLRTVARPAPGVTREIAAERIAAIWPELAERVLSPTWPTALKREVTDAQWLVVPGDTGHTLLRNLFSRPLFVLLGLVALVLLIACANVANLLLARAAAREREIAVRLAVGAARGRIMRQLLTESALLALGGGALGTWLAIVASRLLLDVFAAGSDPLIVDLTPNSHVLAFTVAVAAGTALLFGAAPAFRSSAASPVRALKGEARAGRSGFALLSAIASAQIALSLLLLVGAGLFTQTLENLRRVDAGFNADGVLLADLGARSDGLSGAALVAFYDDLLERMRRIPGVSSASLSSNTPLSTSLWSQAVAPEGEPLGERDNASIVAVMPGFFATLQTRQVAGRDIEARDGGGPNVAVVNEAFAAQFFAGRNPLGQRFTSNVTQPPITLEVVGVVENAVGLSLRTPVRPTVYLSYAQRALAGAFAPAPTIEVRVAGPMGAAAAAMGKELREALPSSLVEVRTLGDQVDSALVQERLLASLGTAFGVLGLLLASIGIYGVFAYRMARQTREIGIRIALGARESSVLMLALKSVLGLLLAGVVVGLPAAWAASRLVESVLFGLRPTDPAVLALAVALLAAAALAAAYFPARRAARLDPMTALRLE